MQVQIAARGDLGVVTTTIQADLEATLTTDGIRYTKAALWGDLDATIKLTGTLDQAYTAAQDWLGGRMQIFANEGTQVWNGYVWSVSWGSGGRKRTRSLDGYANRARLVYDEINAGTTPPTVTTAAKVISVDDTAGQASFGIIEYTSKPGQLVAAQATARNARDLADRRRLLYTPESGTLGGQSTTDAGIITLQGMGFWRTMQYQAYTATTTGTADVAVIVKAILTASCPMLATAQSQILTTGVTAQQQYSAYDSAGTIIKQLVASVDGWTFGLALGRIPYLRPTNKGNTTPDYIELANGMVLDAGGGTVDLATVRPDTLLQQADYLPTSTPAAAVDNLNVVYLVETTYQMPGTLSYKASIPGINGAVSAL
jgi:hypothetical protein